jgi:CubicO group peptidase (beta-lactamase class C family)
MGRDLASAVDEVAEANGFAGVVSVRRDGRTVFARAYGLAHRAYRVPNTLDTRFGIASGTKALTALAVVGLVEQGALELPTTARSVLGTDLPLVDDRVTVEQLLAHRSGIGDYLDEESGQPVTDYGLPVPAQHLAETEQYLAVLDGHPAKFPPGERFSYCNSGYVILALIAERVSGRPFHELVQERVCRPAGLRDTAFFRSDELPERTAVGYLSRDAGSRTNVFHLPVRGNGDGGSYSTAADIDTFWTSLFDGKIVSPHWVAEMVRPRSHPQSARYGLGFWLHRSRDLVALEGYDAGVSFRSVHDPASGSTHTVISNSSEGAWPVARLLAERLDG